MGISPTFENLCSECSGSIFSIRGQSKKYYLPEIFKKDLVQGLVTYAELGKITKANFEKDYLALATEYGAVQCIAYLLEWKKTILK